MLYKLKNIFSKSNSFRVNLDEWRKYPPIFIYQMGKVGSSAVYDSLRAAKLLNPIYHVHFLSPEHILEIKQYLNLNDTGNTLPQHIVHSEELIDGLRLAGDIPVKVITLVREPVSREISNLFQNVKRLHPQLLNEDGAISKQKMGAHLDELFLNFDAETDYACTWMDRELKPVFGVDIYSHDFDRKKGFSYLAQGNVEVLALTLEGLSESFETSIKKIINNRSSIPLVRSNVGVDKWYKEQYAYFCSTYRIREEHAKKIYSTKYVKHFYGDSLIDGFLNRWSSKEVLIHELS